MMCAERIAMERSVNPEGVILLFLISVSYTLASHLEDACARRERGAGDG